MNKVLITAAQNSELNSQRKRIVREAPKLNRVVGKEEIMIASATCPPPSFPSPSPSFPSPINTLTVSRWVFMNGAAEPEPLTNHSAGWVGPRLFRNVSWSTFSPSLPASLSLNGEGGFYGKPFFFSVFAWLCRLIKMLPYAVCPTSI